MDGRRDGASPPFETLPLLGGALCLDFANTLDSRHGEHRRDYLGSYEDLVRWGRHVGVLTASDVDRWRAEARRRPDAASRTFRRAVCLREALYRVFLAVAHGTQPQPTDLEMVSDAYRTAMGHVDIVHAADSFVWRWTGDDLDRVLWPVARSAGELLTQGDLGRVKECPGAGDCGWLFLDTSKNNSRRWCSMEECGSRVKMRRQYARRRERGSP